MYYVLALIFGEGVDGKGRQNYTHFMGVARSSIRPSTTMAEQSINGQGGEYTTLKLKRQIIVDKLCVNSEHGLVYNTDFQAR